MQRIILIIAVVFSMSVLAPTATLAHQPFFEDEDITFDQPWPCLLYTSDAADDFAVV